MFTIILRCHFAKITLKNMSICNGFSRANVYIGESRRFQVRLSWFLIAVGRCLTSFLNYSWIHCIVLDVEAILAWTPWILSGIAFIHDQF